MLNLLSEDTVGGSSLEAIAASFHRHWNRKQDHFRVGNALMMLLQQRDLLPLSSQRIAAIFLLYEPYRSDSLSSNPFSAFFAELLQPSVEDDRASMGLPCGHSLGMVEKAFIIQLLTPSSVPRELFKRTPASIANTDPSTVQPPDITTLLATLHDTQEDFPTHSKVGVSSILADPDPALMSRPDGTAAGQCAETLLCGAEQIMEQPFEPGFMRPLPPLHSCDDEVMWLNPTESQYSIQWDNQMCQVESPKAEARKLLAKAYKEALTVPEQQSLQTQFEEDPELIYHIGLTPQKLPQLVEKNPGIAIEALLKLTNSSSSQLAEYFAALLNMDMSLHSMEVVNRLTTAVDLPPEFLRLYINNCIQKCREIADKSLQSRLVRLVCVFLQSLIRNKTINVQDECVEIQPFCLEYSRIREAAALYRLLKTLDGEGAQK